MKRNLFRVFLSALLITSGASQGAVIKESKQGQSIEFYTNESGTVAKSAELTPGGTLKVNEVTDLAGTGTPPGMIPIGGMVAVMPGVTGAWQPPATTVVKDGFMRADGATVADAASPMNGQVLPNMVNSFARGATTSSITPVGGSDSSTPTGTNTGSAFNGDAINKSTWLGSSAISATRANHTHGLTSAGAALSFVSGHTLHYWRGTNSQSFQATTYSNNSTAATASTVTKTSTVDLLGSTDGQSNSTITFNGNNDNMADWSSGGTYTPTGTMTQPTFTGDSQTNMPVYNNVVWVIRVK